MKSYRFILFCIAAACIGVGMLMEYRSTRSVSSIALVVFAIMLCYIIWKVTQILRAKFK